MVGLLQGRSDRSLVETGGDDGRPRAGESYRRRADRAGTGRCWEATLNGGAVGVGRGRHVAL